jgi:glycerol-3-phosphate dehydrogenase (NAD(P)+)
MTDIGIIGAGAWGTALATVAARAGHAVVIQAHEVEVARAINHDRENSLFLPGTRLPASIRAETDLAQTVQARAVLLAMPAQHLRTVTLRCAEAWPSGVPAVICAKGIELESGALMSQVAAETLPGAPLAVLSGPTFAAEVAGGLPAAATLAAADANLAHELTELLSTPRFRIYRSDDLIGAQIGGAVKNVLAIACGIIAGKGMGDNARAALITRGLAEIMRLGRAMGAKPETLAGLSGLGDLTLTCSAEQSRNFSLGLALGRGEALDQVLAGRKSVAEGVFTAASVCALARRLEVDLPICAAVDGVINHFSDIDAAIENLLSRPLKEETA